LQLIWPWQDRQRRFSALKAGTFALMFAPAIRLAEEYATGQYGFYQMAIGGLLFWTGVWATAVLLLALAITPAQKIFRWDGLIDVRRMVGVAALAYTAIHIYFYFPLRAWNFAFMADEMVKRPTLAAATLSTVLMIALGVTSVDAAVRYMGARNWQRLHNTVYILAVLAFVHILARGTTTEQFLLSGVFFWLMAWRVLDRYGRATDARTLAGLAVAACLFTAFLEAGCTWGRRGYPLAETLGNNFNLDLGVSAAWQALALGLAVALAAAVRHSLRHGRPTLHLRKIG
jgi:methionine sulfoxide reductase heme-binding subunit